MAVKTNYQQIIKQLKNQVKILQKKEERSKAQLRSALQKMRKLGESYKHKLEGKIRVMKSKIADAQASTYGKVALDIERQLLKGIESKSKALASVLSRIEKKQVGKVTKKVSKKSKNPANAKKAKATK